MPPTRIEAEYRPSYLAAAISAAAIFLLYLITLSPTVAMWDAGEYMAAAKVLGLPHPPGNPFFMLLAKAFGMLPVHASFPQRINTLSALTSALSAGIWFLITERALSGIVRERWQRILAGALAALIGGTAFTVWNQSVVNEKVYNVSLLFFTIVSWLALEWADDPDTRRADRILVLIAYLLGLGYANHPAGFLAAPAVAVLILWRRWQTFLRWKLILVSIAALILGLTPFIYEPIRAAHFPAINEGEPTACTVKIEAACTFNKVTYDRLMANINREQYGVKEGRHAPYSAQVGMWWTYFKWQWLRDSVGTRAPAQALLAVTFLMLGLIGGYVHFRSDKKSFWYFGPLMFTMTLALIYYLNFKYGWSQSPELGDAVDREVRDRDYFYIWSFSAWGVWASIGLIYIWRSTAALFKRDPVDKTGYDDEPGRRGLAFAAPILLLALLPLFLNWRDASRSGETFTREWARDLLNSVEPYGILITNGDNDTFPLWYAQEVEGIRKDVTVAVTSYLATDWFTRQLIRRPIADYDAAAGPAIYRNQQWKKPSGPPLRMTFAESDAIPEFIQIPQPQTFRHGNIVATIPAGVLMRDQIVLLRMIKDSYPERPIYLSNGGYGNAIGLGPYTVRQGLAEKLMDRPVVEGGDIMRIGGGMMDVKRSHELWKIFGGPAAMIKRGDWVDRPSYGIPYGYAVTGMLIAEGLSTQNNLEAVRPILKTVSAISKAARIPDFAGAGQ